MIRHWTVLDLNVFREHESDPAIRREIQDNLDGTYFTAYDIRSFPAELVIATSPTMVVALEQGVEAVVPLKPRHVTELEERWRKHSMKDPAPDLQDLISQFGTYSAITKDAWTKYDEQMARWRLRYRQQSTEWP